MSADLNARFAEAVRLAQAGRRAEARAILEDIVAIDPGRDLAWLWLATVSTDPEERVAFLERSLAINPNNPTALTAYSQLTGQAYEPPYQSPPPSRASTQPTSVMSTLVRIDRNKQLAVVGLLVIGICIAIGAVLVMAIINAQPDNGKKSFSTQPLVPTVALQSETPALPGVTPSPTQTLRPTYTPGPSPTPVTLPPTWTPSMTIAAQSSPTPITWTPRPPTETPLPPSETVTPSVSEAQQTAEFVLTSDALQQVTVTPQ